MSVGVMLLKALLARTSIRSAIAVFSLSIAACTSSQTAAVLENTMNAPRDIALNGFTFYRFRRAVGTGRRRVACRAFPTDLGADFKQRVLFGSLAETARRARALPPTHVGKILAQAIVWKSLGPDAVPYSNDVARRRLFEICRTLSQHPIDLTNPASDLTALWAPTV